MPKKTIGDRLVSFYEEFFKVSKKSSAEPGLKEKRLLDPKDFDPVLHPGGYEHLTPEKRREIALMSPLLMKGIKKKSMDTFRAWFTLRTREGVTCPKKIDLDTFAEFEQRAQFKKKLYEARVCAHIYGDGYLLITFLNDLHTSLQDSVSPDSEPFNVELINPEKITSFRKVDDVIYYVYQGDFQEELIHPDRVMHFMLDRLPHSKFGVSTIDILRWTLESNKNVDKATGEILSWFSHGILDLKKDGLTDPERDTLLKIAAKHPGAWIHDEDMTIDYKNPTAINPKPFYEYIILNIAAVLNMPTHVLTGIQTGRVTGSEIGFSDYYRDVRDEQQLIFEPEIESLYTRILQAKGRKFNYVFEWNEIYVDEGMEVELLVRKVQAADTALQGGFITVQEARRMLNVGQIVVNPDDIKDLKKQEKSEGEPPKRPDDRNPDRDSPTRPSLSAEELDMIIRCREAKEKSRKKLLEEERKLGEAILKEQDDAEHKNED